jgi:hypothetical protein
MFTLGVYATSVEFCFLYKPMVINGSWLSNECDLSYIYSTTQINECWVNYTSFFFREVFRNVNQSKKIYGYCQTSRIFTTKVQNDESYLVLVLGRFASHFSNHSCTPCGFIFLILDLLEGKQRSSVGDLITLKLYMFLGALLWILWSLLWTYGT